MSFLSCLDVLLFRSPLFFNEKHSTKNNYYLIKEARFDLFITK